MVKYTYSLMLTRSYGPRVLYSHGSFSKLVSSRALCCQGSLFPELYVPPLNFNTKQFYVPKGHVLGTLCQWDPIFVPILVPYVLRIILPCPKVCYVLRNIQGRAQCSQSSMPTEVCVCNVQYSQDSVSPVSYIPRVLGF